MTINIGSGEMVKILTDLGSYYPMHIGSVATSAGVGSVTWTNTSGYGLIRPTNETMNLVKAGDLMIGDARIFMLPEALSPTIEAGSPVEFQFNAVWYEAEQPETHKVGNEKMYEVANLRRVI